MPAIARRRVEGDEISVWNTIKGWFDKDREHFVFARIDPARVVGRPIDPEPAQAGLHYFRIWLPEMFLSKQVAWFQSLYPAVHSVVRLNFGDQQAVEVPNVADSTKLRIQPSGGQGDIVTRNFLLTPALPFSGGVVSYSAGLIALTGQNYLNAFLKTLGSFASLLSVPQLSSALSVAAPLSEGIQDLFGAGNGRVHLGVMETLDANSFRAGYIAVVRATTKDLDPASLWVVEDTLCVGDKSVRKPLVGCDHLLFRVELFTERDDWDQLTAISKPYQEALNLLASQNLDRANESLRMAVLAALKAPELTQAHRRTVIETLKKRFAEAKAALATSGLAPQSEASLTALMKGARPPQVAHQEGPISVTEAFEGLLG